MIKQKNVLSPNNVLACFTVKHLPFGRGFRIASTLPVTSATCERSISTLRLLKTQLRSTMSNSRMNDLAMMFIHRKRSNPKALKFDTIDEFAARNPRRMEWSDLGARQDSE